MLVDLTSPGEALTEGKKRGKAERSSPAGPEGQTAVLWAGGRCLLSPRSYTTRT